VPVKSVAQKLKELSAVPVAAETVAPVPVKTIAQKLKELSAPVAVETAAPVPVKSVAPKLKELAAAQVVAETAAPVPVKSVAPKLKELAAPVVADNSVFFPVPSKSDTSNVGKKSSDDEFTIVLSKNSKKGKISQITTLSIAEKHDDFPTLGTPSSSPAIGFWGSGKDPIEMAKQVAKKPSPPPTRSPTLNTSSMRMEIRSKSRNSNSKHEDDEGFYDEDFSHRKQRHGDEDDNDDYWQ